MVKYHEDYLEKYFDEYDFFNPEHRDRRVREVWLRTKKCLEEQKAFESFQLHPNNWVTGFQERLQKNSEMK